MPGPGPHMMYAMSSGAALTSLSGGRFGPHHTLFYAINAFFGPDLGSFAEWLGSLPGSGLAEAAGSGLAEAVHHPLYYVVVLGLPLCFLYARLSEFLLRSSILHSGSWVPLNKRQCLCLVSAGSLSHFFLDHLFEENGHSTMYTWILSTGWWNGRAPINPDAVFVIGLLCSCLLGGFIYVNRVKPYDTEKSVKLLVIVASLYCVWCASQIYWANPRRPAVGEEADLGVIVLLATYFCLPHYFCILSMHPKEEEQIPL